MKIKFNRDMIGLGILPHDGAFNVDKNIEDLRNEINAIEMSDSHCITHVRYVLQFETIDNKKEPYIDITVSYRPKLHAPEHKTCGKSCTRALFKGECVCPVGKQVANICRPGMYR